MPSSAASTGVGHFSRWQLPNDTLTTGESGVVVDLKRQLSTWFDLLRTSLAERRLVWDSPAVAGPRQRQQSDKD